MTISDSLWELFKTVFGPFFGAGAALLLSERTLRKKRDEEHLTAGNMALAILSQQYGDFVILKASVETQMAGLHRDFPEGVPPFLQLSAMLFEFDEELAFDFASLAFLLDTGKSDLVEKLVIVQSKHKELGRIAKSHTAAALKRSRLLAEAEIDINIPVDYDQARTILKMDFVAELESLVNAMQRRLAADNEIYAGAGAMFREAMLLRFKPNQVAPFRAFGAQDAAIAVANGTASALPHPKMPGGVIRG